jgi:NAD(P)-dependent dehydrogenase (short-subunit alcohol dehydrogenase family)
VRLQGKAGIVVGAGQQRGETVGNGRAAAVLFAREGATVLCVDRDRAAAAETVEQIRREGGTAEVFVGDWTDAEACSGYAARCLELAGKVDFLHNNVGAAAGDSTPENVAVGSVRDLYEINTVGCLLSCRAVLPAMVAAGTGSIVNVSSIAATANTPQLAYKMSKAAQNALTQTLAMTYAADGVRVNGIAPGFLDTPVAMNTMSALTGVGLDDLRRERAARVPLRHRMGTAWDTAYAGLFLHSDEASFVTGVVLPVDGGHLANVGGELVGYATLKSAQDQPARST